MTNPMTRASLDAFVQCNKADAPNKREATGSEANPEGRWRSYGYAERVSCDKCSLDLFWLKHDSLLDAESLPDPEVLAAEIMGELRVALGPMEEIWG
jgi:type I restriction enzyme M protein